MTPEHDDKLCKDFPQIFKNRHKDPKETLMCWGFECGDGWFDLIYDLCTKLTALYEAMPPEQKEVYKDFAAAQVKEKFGGLRFYMDCAPEAAYALIDEAEEKSYTICEVCGEPGERRSGSWIKTLCDKHHQEREQQRAEYRKKWEQRQKESNESP